MAEQTDERQHRWKDEGRDLMRGIGGAAIIGVPLVYTMEMWQVATTFSAKQVLTLLCFGFAVCIGYNLFSGFRNNSGIAAAIKDALEAVAIGVIFSIVLMLLLGIIDSSTSLSESVAKVTVEAIPLAMGASVANRQFDGGQQDQSASNDNTQNANPDEIHQTTLREVGIAAAGSLVFAASIAPTEEVALLAQRTNSSTLITIALFSLALSYGMIFVADFTGSDKRRKSPGILQSPIGETVLSYAVALAVSYVAISFFHGVRIADSPMTIVALTISLGLPAAIGGAAGRLLI